MTAPRAAGGVPVDPAPLIEMRGITKHFGGVAALVDVDFRTYPGEIVALLGDNGAGKSTLIKILSGVESLEEGEIRFAGHPVPIHTPGDAKELGIETVYQDLALCDNLDVPTNMFLGRELMRPILGPLLRVFAKKKMARETRAVLDRLKIDVTEIYTAVRHLSGGQRQSVAIAKTVYVNAKAVIMDEPTAALGVVQTAKVLQLARDLKRAGLSVVFISHNLEDVFQVADRMVVLKNGRKVGERFAADTNREEIVRMMITGHDGCRS